MNNNTRTSSKKESERNDLDEPGNNLSQKRLKEKKQGEGRRKKKEDGLKKLTCYARRTVV